MRSKAHRLALCAIGLALLGWVGFLAVVVTDQSVDDGSRGKLVAIFPPELDRATTLDRLDQLDARIVRSSAIPFVLTLFSDAPGFAGRLRAAGAVGVFHSTGLIQCVTWDF